MLRWTVVLVALALAGSARADMAVEEPELLGMHLPEIVDELSCEEAEALVDRYGLDPHWLDTAWDEADAEEDAELPADGERV